ncbi:MAG: histidine kinase [Acidobacteria bacterium]|nr:histidine kinase [Acidobacteriota bacterium]
MQRRLTAGLPVFAYFTAVGLLLFGYRYFERVASRTPVSMVEQLVNELVTGAWTAALLYPIVARFARTYPFEKGCWILRLAQHAGALLLFSLAHTSLIYGSRWLIYPIVGQGSCDFGLLAARYPMEFFHDAIAYPTIVSILYLNARHLRAAQLEAHLAQARLENLRLQLQPHFLFNALNTISSVVYEDPRKADAMIARLSDLLRSTITGPDSQMVPLDREIETLELYLDIMRQRFEDKLSAKVEIAPEVRQALVPHLLLQPLVENSIRHGIHPSSSAVNVTVTAERDGDQTRVFVRDNGRGLPNGPLRRGTGLSNIAERLQQLYGSAHTLRFDNLQTGGLQVTIAIPYRT